MRQEVLEQVIARDSKIGSVYSRAWEIVNKLEGAEALVEELRRSSPR